MTLNINKIKHLICKINDIKCIEVMSCSYKDTYDTHHVLSNFKRLKYVSDTIKCTCEKNKKEIYEFDLSIFDGTCYDDYIFHLSWTVVNGNDIFINDKLLINFLRMDNIQICYDHFDDIELDKYHIRYEKMHLVDDITHVLNQFKKVILCTGDLVFNLKIIICIFDENPFYLLKWATVKREIPSFMRKFSDENEFNTIFNTKQLIKFLGNYNIYNIKNKLSDDDDNASQISKKISIESHDCLKYLVYIIKNLSNDQINVYIYNFKILRIMMLPEKTIFILEWQMKEINEHAIILSKKKFINKLS